MDSAYKRKEVIGDCTLYLGDCLEIMPPLGKVDAVVTDPPYNIGVDTWDNIKDYDAWLLKVFVVVSRCLLPNGSLWFFHMTFPELAALHVGLVMSTDLRHKQIIVLNKGLGSIAGRTSDKLRSYPRATEYLQVYTFEDLTGAQQLSDRYAAINPMAGYLRSELDRSTVTQKDLMKLFPSKTGGLTGCVSNWLIGYNLPSQEQYDIIKSYMGNDFLRREYEELRREYEELRREYEELRRPFNLEFGVTDVWDWRYSTKAVDHATPKPLVIVARVVKSCSNVGSVILDPFMGSGTGGVVCVELGRKYIGIEKDEQNFNEACERIANTERQEDLFRRPVVNQENMFDD